MRVLIFFGGLVATIALTVVGAQWLVPTEVVPTAFGLEVAAGEPEPTVETRIRLAPTPTAEVVAAEVLDDGKLPLDGYELRPTINWINVFSENSEIDGAPLPVGSTVYAFDPDGALAGRVTVTREGIYGLMAVYMDDPSTAVDEGAVLGDALRFVVDGYPAEVAGPDSPVWTQDGGLLRLDLRVSTEF